jgi:hypothetical protein
MRRRDPPPRVVAFFIRVFVRLSLPWQERNGGNRFLPVGLPPNFLLGASPPPGAHGKQAVAASSQACHRHFYFNGDLTQPRLCFSTRRRVGFGKSGSHD